MDNRQYFDAVAGNWDTIRQGFFSDNVREVALRLACVQATKTAADIGAGTGYMTEALLRRGLHVVAVDHSPEMIGRMEQKFRGRDRLELRLSRSDTLPLADESVDYTFANMYLHHTESPARAIRKMARILKVGGVLVITDLDEHNFEFLRTEQYDRWMGFKRENIRSWFTQGGLRQVEVISANETCSCTSMCGTQKAAVSIFAAAGRRPGREQKHA